MFKRNGTAVRFPILVIVVMAAVMVVGALLYIEPYLTEKRAIVSEVPGPAALFSLAEFAVPRGGHICMYDVAVGSNSRVAEFHLRPEGSAKHGGPPVRLIVSSAGYKTEAQIGGGYPGGSASVPITAPRRSLIATACFVDLGNDPVLFDGTTEQRTMSRSPMYTDGRRVTGDIALTFLDSRPASLLERLGEVFGHASNITDDLVPVWLIWIVVMLSVVGVPASVVAAFFLALRSEYKIATPASTACR